MPEEGELMEKKKTNETNAMVNGNNHKLEKKKAKRSQINIYWHLSLSICVFTDQLIAERGGGLFHRVLT